MVVEHAIRARSTIRGRSVQKFSPSWAAVVAGNIVRKKVLRKIISRRGVPFGWWLSARRTPAVMSEFEGATAMSALDDGAVYTVWRASRINVTAPAVNGIGPLLDRMELTLRD